MNNDYIVCDRGPSIVDNKMEELENHIDFLHTKISELEDRLYKLERE